MTRNDIFQVLLVAGLCVAGSAAVRADGHPRIPEDPAAPAQDRHAAIRDTLELCAGCHGDGGASRNPEYPILAGQHFYYLYVQLKDFKAGRRASEVMSPLVAEMERAELRALATYFSEQAWPNIGFRGEASKVARGERATVGGQCVQCHRGGYEGDSRVPRLAGQHPQYLRKTMADFKSKTRANSPSKSSLMESYDDGDLAAMAEFLADK